MKYGLVFLLLLAIGVVIAITLSACTPAYKSITGADTYVHECTPTEAKTLIDEHPRMPIIDIRTAREFNEGHIVNATNIDYYDATFEEQIALLAKESAYLVHCRSGNRSGKALVIFLNLGFTNIYHLTGGINAWKAEGLPLVTNN